MSFRDLLALHVGAILFLSGAAAIADDDDDDDDDEAPAVQIMSDDKGRALDADDDGAKAPQFKSSVVTDTGLNANISVMMSAESGPAQYHADGTVSAKLGLDQMNVLVVQVDENGELVYSHNAKGDLSAPDVSINSTEEEK